MNKIALYFTLGMCFIIYGAGPVALSGIMLSLDSSDLFFQISSVISLAISLLMLIGIWMLFKKNIKGRTYFVSALLVSTSLQLLDLVVPYFSQPSVPFTFNSVIEVLLVPLITLWLLYYSDVNDELIKLTQHKAK